MLARSSTTPASSKCKKFRRHQWKFGTINVRTASTDDKCQEIVRQVSKVGLTVCAVQEVKRIGNESRIIETTNPHTSKPRNSSFTGHARQTLARMLSESSSKSIPVLKWAMSRRYMTDYSAPPAQTMGIHSNSSYAMRRRT